MRVSFVPLSVKEFDILLKDESGLTIRGAGLSDINVYVPKTNRGGSLFQILANLVKSAAPLLMRTVAPEGINFAKNVIEDISSGEKLRGTLKRRGIESLKALGKKIIKGGGRKRSKSKGVKRITNSKKNRKKKDRYNDIFSRV